MSVQLQGVTNGYMLARPGVDPVVPGQTVDIDGDRIADHPGAEGTTLDVPDGLVLPAPSNGHDHGRALSTLSFGSHDVPLELWLPATSSAPRVPVDLVATVFCSRTARAGLAGSVVLHNLKPAEVVLADAVSIAAAAHAVGTRIAFGVAMQDTRYLALGIDDPTDPLLGSCGFSRSDIPYLPTTMLPPDEWIELVEEVDRRAGSELVDVQFGPLGPQWISDPLAEAIAAASARTGRRVHMHMLETPRQREWADATYPGGLLRHLDTIGLLSPRLTIAHGVWLRPDEIELLVERGVTVSVNTSSNLRLRSGFAPVADMLRAGLAVAAGLDGRAFDDDGDYLRELRLFTRVFAGTGMTADIDVAAAWQVAVTGGARAVHGGPGSWGLPVGGPADLVVLDRPALDGDILEAHRDHAELVAARATTGHVRHLVVAGQHVVRDGTVVGVDEQAAETELLERLFELADEHAERSRFLPELQAALQRHYELGRHTQANDAWS